MSRLDSIDLYNEFHDIPLTGDPVSDHLARQIERVVDSHIGRKGGGGLLNTAINTLGRSFGAIPGALAAKATGGDWKQGALAGAINTLAVPLTQNLLPNFLPGINNLFSSVSEQGLNAAGETGANIAGNVLGAAAPAGASAAAAPAALEAAGSFPIDLTSALQGGDILADAVASSAPNAFSSAPLALGDLGISAGQQAALNNLGISVPSAAASNVNEPLLGGIFQNPGVLSAPSSAATNAGVNAAAAAAPGGFNYDASTLGKIFTSLGLPQGAVTEAIAKNPGALLSGGGLAYNLLAGNKLPAGYNQLKSQAEQLGAQGSQLASYLQSGQLPPGAQASLSQATESAKAAIRSKYAQLGMSGSTAEQQELNNIDLQAQAQGFNIAANLLSQGVNETGLSANIYNNLLGINQKEQEATGNAISNFASALGGYGNSGGTTIRIG